MSLVDFKRDLDRLADSQRAKVSAWFFKTGSGQYGEGDVFLGITVPKQREVAKKYMGLRLSEIQKLLLSKIHEHRFVALAILVGKFKNASSFPQSFPPFGKLRVNARESSNWIPHQVRDDKRKQIFDFYIKNAKKVNNWDLVDASAEYIVGEYLASQRHSGLTRIKSKDSGVVESDSTPQNDILVRLARSKDLWERRIAIVSTFAFIKKGRLDDTFKIAEILLSDTHDLIHKAVGWMLREVGKKDQSALESFLLKHYKKMPRTTLRYAIEKFDVDKKNFFMMR